MKNTLKRILAYVLTIAMFVSVMPMVFAEGTEQMDEMSAGTVTLAATNISLEKSAEVQTGTISFYMDKNVQLGSMGITYTTAAQSAVTLGTAVADEALKANATINESLSYSNMNGGYATYNDSLEGYLLFTLPVTVAANAEGTFTVTFTITDFCDADNGDGYSLASRTVTSTITVTGGDPVVPPATNGVSLSSTTTNVDNNGVDKVIVTINVPQVFNSAKIELSYNSAILGYPTVAPVTPTGEGGVAPSLDVGTTDKLIISDYGSENAAGAAYTLTFTPVNGGTATVTLISAAFGTSETAENQNLTLANLDEANKSVAVTINHKVTIGSSVSYVAPGGTLNGTIPDYNANYNYTITSVTMGGASQSIPTVTNGTFTIANVTGDVVIEYTTEAKQYDLTWSEVGGAEGETIITNKSHTDKAIYNQNITFNVPANQDPVGTTNGYKYTVVVTGVDSTAVTCTDNGNGMTYTINGTAITGAISVTVTKEVVLADTVIIAFTGERISATANGNALDTSTSATVAKGAEIVLTISPVEGYTFTVTVGGAVVELINNTYTFTANEGTTVNVTKNLAITAESLTVQQYVKLDGKDMLLVTINVGQISGKTYKYSGADNTTGENFYWSDKYAAKDAMGGYCFLIVTDAKESYQESDWTTIKESILPQLTIVDDAAAIAISYNGNVNLTTGESNIDVNDAQLVWNMYSAVYQGISANVTVQKFLEADVNTSGNVDTEDAAAVIIAIKAQ